MKDSEIFAAIEGAVGRETACAICAAFGGMLIEINEKEKLIDKFGAVIGKEKARALCKYFNGEKVYFPRRLKEALVERNRNILKCFDGGMSANEICTKFNLSERQIRKILKNVW